MNNKQDWCTSVIEQNNLIKQINGNIIMHDIAIKLKGKSFKPSNKPNFDVCQAI